MSKTDRIQNDSVWEEKFRVRTYEIDINGVANLASLCNYLQEAAGNHAEKLHVSIDDLGKDNKTWVLSRLRLSITNQPKLGQTITVRTWPSGTDRLFTTRDFEILDEDGHYLVKATSVWLVIDRTTRRPYRLPESIVNLIRPDTPRALTIDLHQQLPEPDHTVRSAELIARRSDLDVNGHVNNVHYIEWAIEPMDNAFLKKYRPVELTVQFLAESRQGTNVTSNLNELDNENSKLLRHQLIKKAEETPLARLETRWVAQDK